MNNWKRFLYVFIGMESYTGCMIIKNFVEFYDLEKQDKVYWLQLLYQQ